MEQYFNENEENDFKMLLQFNEKTNLFSNLDRTPSKHYYDASGHTRDGREVIIELKRRNIDLIEKDGGFLISGMTPSSKPYIEDNILLSAHKAVDLMFDALAKNQVALHLTLSNNAVIIHDLLHLKHRPMRYARVRSYSKGYDKYEYESKQGMYLQDAIIYIKDGDTYGRKK